MKPRRRLKLLPKASYPDAKGSDPLRFYFVPFLGTLFRRRIELCLGECRPAERVLEVGFGSGLATPSLADMYGEVHGIDLSADVQALSLFFAKSGVAAELRNGNLLDLPYSDGYFDTVLLVSILEHIRPVDLVQAFAEIVRVLKPSGQVVYGVPVHRPLMTLAFHLLGCRIREHHHSTEREVAQAARRTLNPVRTTSLRLPFLGALYEVGHLRRRPSCDEARK